MIGIGVNLVAGLPDSADPGWNLVDEVVARARAVAAAGLRTVWLPQNYGYDALTLFAALAREVPDVELGASVVVAQPRHPRVLAAQALTVQAASGGRLALGLGVSHPGLLEVYGIPFDRPVAALRAHLDVLLPLLAGHRAPGAVGPGSDPADSAVPGAEPEVPVLLGALGPTMLRLAGERTAGAITFLTGPRTIERHVVAHLQAAAGAARRARVVAGVPVSATDDPDRIRAAADRDYAPYAALPSYAGVLEREGLPSPGGLVVAGDEAAVVAGLRRYAAAGATDVLVSPLGDAAEVQRTLTVLGSLARASAQPGPT